MTDAKEQQLIRLLNLSLLDDDELENEEPWGEDGAVHAFDQGQRHGAHELAAQILELLK